MCFFTHFLKFFENGGTTGETDYSFRTDNGDTDGFLTILSFLIESFEEYGKVETKMEKKHKDTLEIQVRHRDRRKIQSKQRGTQKHRQGKGEK